MGEVIRFKSKTKIPRDDIDPLGEVMELIDITQGGEWDGRCSRVECYWNMYHPINDPDESQCTSENLAFMKMVPNTVFCPSYEDFEDACGCRKGDE